MYEVCCNYVATINIKMKGCENPAEALGYANNLLMEVIRMAKAPIVPEVPESQQQSSQPKLFAQCEEKFGPNQDLWPIWVREEYAAWKSGGSAPSGELPRDYFTKRPEEPKAVE